jgi:hypothetical protein
VYAAASVAATVPTPVPTTAVVPTPVPTAAPVQTGGATDGIVDVRHVEFELYEGEAVSPFATQELDHGFK